MTDNTILSQLTKESTPVMELVSPFIIRAFDKRGEWFITRVYPGGHPITVTASEDEVNALESELAESDDWRINPSLNHNGFSARLMTYTGSTPLSAPSADDDYIPALGEPVYPRIVAEVDTYGL